MIARTAADQTNARRRLVPLTLGIGQLAIMVVSLVVVSAVAGIVAYPAVYVRYIQDYGLKPFEARYGFRTGAVAPILSASQVESTWGVVWVEPDGLFAQLGVRTGDIPFDYHGGPIAMYGALRLASSGEASAFQVYNSNDAHLGHSALRWVNLPPLTK